MAPVKVGSSTINKHKKKKKNGNSGGEGEGKQAGRMAMQEGWRREAAGKGQQQ